MLRLCTDLYGEAITLKQEKTSFADRKLFRSLHMGSRCWSSPWDQNPALCPHDGGEPFSQGETVYCLILSLIKKATDSLLTWTSDNMSKSGMKVGYFFHSTSATCRRHSVESISPTTQSKQHAKALM